MQMKFQSRFVNWKKVFFNLYILIDYLTIKKMLTFRKSSYRALIVFDLLLYYFVITIVLGSIRKKIIQIKKKFVSKCLFFIRQQILSASQLDAKCPFSMFFHNLCSSSSKLLLIIKLQQGETLLTCCKIANAKLNILKWTYTISIN